MTFKEQSRDVPGYLKRSRPGMNSQHAVLGVDIGTSSSKAVLVALDGRPLALAVRPHTTSTPHPGWFEQDAELVWWGDFVELTRELLARCPSARVTAVATSGLGPCVLPADADNHALRPAILYGIDTRAERQIGVLESRLGAGAILARSGNRLTSQAVGPKLMWLRDEEPGVWALTRRMYMASSYVVARLTGEYVLDHHSASQAVPMYLLAERRWNESWCAELAPRLELPRLAWPEEIVGALTPTAAALTGLEAGTPVTCGTIDAWAEGISVGATTVGDVMIMYGTTMFLTAVTDRALTSNRLWSTAGARRDTFTLAGGMATSGAITDWFRRLTATDYPELVAAAAEVPAGSRGLLLLPYFAGERTPLFEPRARGVLAGLTLGSGPGEIYRAILEGTAFGVRHNLEAFEAAGADITRLVAVGGGAGHELWPTIVSSVIGHPQQLTRETVGAALGDAMLAAAAVGEEPDMNQWNPVVGAVEPDPESSVAYQALWPHYLELHRQTRAIQSVLADFNMS